MSRQQSRSVRFSPGPLSIQSQVLGHCSSVRYGLYFMKQAFNPVRKWLITPITFVSLLNQYVQQPSHCCRLQGFQLGGTEDYPCLSLVCSVPSCTVNTSQWGEAHRKALLALLPMLDDIRVVFSNRALPMAAESNQEAWQQPVMFGGSFGQHFNMIKPIPGTGGFICGIKCLIGALLTLLFGESIQIPIMCAYVLGNYRVVGFHVVFKCSLMSLVSSFTLLSHPLPIQSSQSSFPFASI